MSQIPDQIPIWDQKHEKGDHTTLRGVPSPLAERAVEYFADESRILELGCGVGRDAVYFAQCGHEVVATDGSATVIKQNKMLINQSGVTFEKLDMRQTFPYNSESFNVVYANLSLHYYSDEKTREILKEMTRVLKLGGLLVFACKSYDSLHNTGREIEPNIIISPTGATLHLFSVNYVDELLANEVSVEYIDEIEEDFNGRQSKIIRCIARK